VALQAVAAAKANLAQFEQFFTDGRDMSIGLVD